MCRRGSARARRLDRSERGVAHGASFIQKPPLIHCNLPYPFPSSDVCGSSAKRPRRLASNLRRRTFMASTAEKLQALQEAFATIDLENIEETLEACGGDLAKTTEVLTEILMEEEEEEQMAAQQRGSSPLSVPRGRAAGSSGSVATDSGAASDTALPDGPPAGTMLRALLDVVVSLAQTPAEQRTAASEERLSAFCARLDASGIRLTAPIQKLLDGERDERVLIGGLDEADAEVVRQMLALIAAGAGALPSAELSEAEKTELVLGFGTSNERVALQTVVAANQADLAAKQEATELLKRAVIKQRLGREEEEAPTAVSGAR